MPTTLIADYDEDSTLIFRNTEEFEESPLQVISLKPLGNVYQKRTARFTAKIKNISNTEYYGPIFVNMVNYDNPNEKLMSKDFHLTIKSGEEIECEIHIENVNTSVGNYHCFISYDSYNGNQTAIKGEYYDSPDTDFPVLDVPTESLKLTITENPSFVNSTNDEFFSHETPIYTTKISNTGGYAQIYVAIVIFDSTKKAMHSFATKKVMIDKNETVDLSFVCDNSFTLPAKWKMLTPTDKNLLPFTITDGKIDNIENPKLADINAFPTQTTDFINISSEENISKISVYSLTGANIITIEPNTNSTTLDLQSINQGFYLLVVETSNHKKTIKINKI